MPGQARVRDQAPGWTHSPGQEQPQVTVLETGLWYDELADSFDALVRARGYENRSEAFRDLLRQDLGNVRLRDRPHGPCVSTLNYAYHHKRQLALRLTDLQHDHHELTVSTTHAHLDQNHCIETVILRGQTAAVEAFAESVIAQPGVSHGHVHLVPMAARHAHGHEQFEQATAHPGEPLRRRRKASGRR